MNQELNEWDRVPKTLDLSPEAPPAGASLFIENLFLLPFRLLWNLLVTVALVAFAVAWWGFLFGSGVVFIIALVFAPDLFIVPIFVVGLYMPLWPDE